MKQEIIDGLDKHFQKYPQAAGNPIEEQKIIEAEKELGLLFSDSYKAFLKKYGGGCVIDFDVYGLSKAEFMSETLWSVIQNTNFYKNEQKWPDIDDWYIISDDGRGNPIGCKPDGSVWLSDHDAGFEQVKLADNFEKFLNKLLTDTLYE